MTSARLRAWARRLGLHRRDLRAWALYDWANSAFVTTVVTAVFPVYFADVIAADLPRARATGLFATSSTVALALAAAASPLLGAVGDRWPIKKRLLFVSAALGVLATLGLAFVGRGDTRPAALLFVIGNVGLSASFVFYDSLLPHIATEAEADRVSSAGYALGYLGGGVLLVVNLAWIQWPSLFGLESPEAACRASFASVALWWAAFSIPLFRRVPEPPVPACGATPGVLERLAATGRELRAFPQALRLLVAYFFYNDGIGTIYRMAAIYGAEIGLSRGALLATLAASQFVSIPFAFLFGLLADRIGAKRAVLLSLGVYLCIGVSAYSLHTERGFFLLAMMVAAVQGGAQSLSRSLFATMIPRQRSAQLFGLFGVFDKVSGVLGPAVFAWTSATTGSSRHGILSVAAFFVIGGGLLLFVDTAAGRRAARAAEAES